MSKMDFTRRSGNVKKYFSEKGFGFIAPSEALPRDFQSKDVYFHFTKLERRDGLDLEEIENAEVVFLLNPESQEKPSADRVWVCTLEERDKAADGELATIGDSWSKDGKSRSRRLPTVRTRKYEMREGGMGESSREDAMSVGSPIRRAAKEIPNTTNGPGIRSTWENDSSDGDVLSETQLVDTSDETAISSSSSSDKKNRRDKFAEKPRQRNQWRGKVVSVKEAIGFLRALDGLPPDYNDKDVYFRLDKAGSGYLRPKVGDVYDFTLATKDKTRPSAWNLRMIKASKRHPQDWVDYLTGITKAFQMDAKEDGTVVLTDNLALCLPREYTSTDLMVGVLSCAALWEELGNCIEISDDGLKALLDILNEMGHQAKSMEESFRSVLRILSQSRLLHHKTDRFRKFISNMITSDDRETVLKIEYFLMVMMKQIPDKSRLVVNLVRPVVESCDSPACTFLYKLLKAAVRDSLGNVDDMEWDELPLVPSVSELLGGPLESSLNLQPVKTDRPYQSCLEYIDTYFRLLRSDCFNALSVGVGKLLKGKLDSRDMNVYRDVNIAGIQLTQGTQGVSLAMMLAPDTPKDIEQSRKLMFGNLICITASGSFRDPVWATVSNRELLKSHRMVTLDLCSECNNQTDAEVIVELQSAGTNLIMVESPTYYKAYQPVLRALQKLEPNNIALHDEIVHIRPPALPSYIHQDTTMDANILYENIRHPTPVMQFCESTQELGNTTLDTSQEASVRSSLKNRVAIIQGPPGTGKTYIGINLVKLLLSISTFPRQPILVLTYKNHALDEFLKDVLQVTKSILRVGGRSSDPELVKYTLQEARREFKLPEALFKQIQQANSDIATCKADVEGTFEALQNSRMLDVEGFVKYLNKDQLELLLQGCTWKDTSVKPLEKPGKSNGWQKKLSKKDRITKNEVFDVFRASNLPETDCLKSVENPARHQLLRTLLDAAFKQWLPSQEAFKGMEANVSTLLQPKLNIPKSNETSSKVSEQDERDPEEELKERLAAYMTPGKTSKEEILKEIRFLQDITAETSGNPHLIAGAKALMTNAPCGILLGVDDVWGLEADDRIRLVQYMIYTNYKEAGTVFEEALTVYQRNCQIKNEMEDQHKINILRGRKVIGMTMTGASIYNHYLKAIRPSVVLVEEAAEVMEPLLISALGDWAEHLILIGDHKQLRPSVESYVLARDYHLDVSMMERLINNNQPYAALVMQNRMKPEFAELLLDIYPHLQSNLTLVEDNRQADCIGKSMFFWATDDPENKERSCTNKGEAERAIRLGLFLVQQGYRPTSITILAPYLGQVTLIRRMIKEAKDSHKKMFEPFETAQEDTEVDDTKRKDDNTIRAHTIDMFQGDENDFVIISLVRSNTKGELGFLKILNRRCVAQSRARRGMYFIGNRNLLESNRHWMKMIRIMQEKGCTGTAIPLHCPKHPNISKIAAVDADDITLGAFCRERCMITMPCGKHICKNFCQPCHGHRLCLVKVNFVFRQCGHPGERQCYKDETKVVCTQEMTMIFPKCKHRGSRLCCEKEESKICKEACTLTLPCGHPCVEECGKACNPDGCPTCMKIKEIEAKKRRDEEERIRRQTDEEIMRQLEQMKKVDPGHFTDELKPDGDTASEYLDMEDRVKKYIQPGHNWFPIITKIEKVTNLQLEKRWLREKLLLLDPRKRSELKFHGTTKEAIDAIIGGGFKMPTWKNQMYGAGLYFASDSSKSAQEIYTKGSNMLLMSDILLGKSMTVDKAHTMMTYDQLHERGYDSLFAKRGTHKSGGVLNDEFVVYHPNQAIPRYIIHYDATGINSDFGRLSDLEQQALKSASFLKHTITPKRTVNYTSDPLDIHFRMAESQFLRLMQRTGGTHTVTSVDYYINPPLLSKFQAKSQEFQAKYPKKDEAQCILAFHGTKEGNIDGILKQNFRLEKLASNTGDRGYYGAGIYFSEFPNVSIGYGGCKKLLLCKVVPGRSYDCPGLMMGAALKPTYDSHRAEKDKDGRGQELVIFDPDQILPCYVINFS